MRIIDWSSDVCSSDLAPNHLDSWVLHARGLACERPQSRNAYFAYSHFRHPAVVSCGLDMSRRKYRCLVRVLSDHDTADYCQLRITSVWQMERVNCPDIARELALRSEEHTSELQTLMRNSY